MGDRATNTFPQHYSIPWNSWYHNTYQVRVLASLVAMHSICFDYQGIPRYEEENEQTQEILLRDPFSRHSLALISNYIHVIK